MHDPTKFLLGATNSSARDVSRHDSDPDTFKAGLAVRLASTGALVLEKASGELIGVSLGKDLSDIKKTAVARTGLGVPIQITGAGEEEDDYSYAVIGEPVWIDDATGKANVEDDGDVTTTISAAVYASGVLDGVAEDGTLVKCILIDMPGGL